MACQFDGRERSGRALDSTSMRLPPSATASAGEAADDDAEEGDYGVDDGLETSSDGVDNGHDAVADCPEDGLDARYYGTHDGGIVRVRMGVGVLMEGQALWFGGLFGGGKVVL